MTAGMIDVARHGKTVLVTLRRPPANALNIELTEEIASVFSDLGQDDDVKSVVLTGHGKSFCAGVDLKIVPTFDRGDQRRMVNALNRAFCSVFACPLPVVGAINGHAIAGGLVLALCCDWRIASKTPFLAGLTEVRVGVPYPVAAMEVARHELRSDVARRLVLFGDNIASTDAMEAGVFDEAIDAGELLQRALAKAEQFAVLPQAAFAQTKRQLRSSAIEAIDAAIAGAEPLLDKWLSRQTVAAAATVLAGRG
ncbi:MAG: enoyl-CoA hydratase/isomerase family protein [Bradyrhizobium sp.]